MKKTGKQVKVEMRRYEYPLCGPDGKVYYGSYSILPGVEPLYKPNERLVQTFTTYVLKK